ncbi:hypothetical protein HDU83_003153 [Entophlyctis luteolus]|nr:hypothetical protein HDU83_003153 [Entophlyctis luteolus]
MRRATARDLRGACSGPLTTGSASLDRELSGGLRCGQITEVFGESSAGKTQLAMQLCVTCQWPPSLGGLGGGAALLLTDENFSSTRLRDLARTLTPQQSQRPSDSSFASDDAVRQCMDNVHVMHVRDPEMLCHAAQYMLPVLFERHRLKLVIVDSVASVLRYGFTDSGIDFGASAKMESKERNDSIIRLARALKKLAADFDAVVVCINQVTAKFIPDRPTAGRLLLAPIATGSSDKIENCFSVDPANCNVGDSAVMPALGLLWTSCINTRLSLSKEDKADYNASAREGFKLWQTRRRLKTPKMHWLIASILASISSPLLAATVLATAKSIRGSYWAATSDAGGCSLPVASYANTHYAFALGDQAALGSLSFAPKYCGQMFQINCGHSSVLAVVASTCDIGGHDCGADMIAPLWNAATANASPGLVNCSLSLTTSNPISSSTAPICFYRPSSEFGNAYYKLLGVLNTSGRLVSGAKLAGISGTVSSGDWYQFQAGASPFKTTDSVVFTYTDGTSSTFALSQCVQPSGVQIFS